MGNLNSSYAIKLSKFKSKLSIYSWSVFRAILIIGLCTIILYPLFTKVAVSFMTVEDIFDLSVRWIPRNFTLDNYRIALEWMNYSTVFLRTLTLVLIVSVLQLASSTFVGYGFARHEFKGRGILFALVILTLVVPPQMIMIPLFLNFRFFNIFGLIPEPGWNLLGSYWPFVLTSMTAMGMKNGLFIYIMRQHFRGMPDTLEEAAYVDGAGSFRTFFQVMLPGAVPVMIIVFLFSFVWQWNDIFYLFLYIRDAQGFLASSLANFAEEFRRFSFYASISGVDDQYLSILENAGMVLFIAPVLVLYAFLQKYFIESVSRTGIVG
ncbi:carbohydrate ABC transporter permease [Natronospora cellulosivora (SeqCode)]